jgi:hypothetical protein
MGGTRAHDCRQLPGSDGRDRLVCEDIDGHQGHLGIMLFLMDAGKDPSTFADDFERVFFGMMDDTGAGACNTVSEDGEPTSDSVLQIGAITRVEFISLPAKYQVRIVVYASDGSIKIPAKLRERIRAGDAPEPDITPAIKPTRYEFTFDGTKIQ